MYVAVEVEFSSLPPLVFRRFVPPDDPQRAQFIVASAPFETFETEAGATYRCTQVLSHKPDPRHMGPEQAHAAIDARTKRRPVPSRPNDADMAVILDALEKHLADRFVDVPAGAMGNDPRPFNLRNALALCIANVGSGRMAAQLVAKVSGEDVDALASVAETLDTSYDATIARTALKRRDDLLAQRVAETKAQKKQEEEGKRPNTKTLRELGYWAVRQPLALSGLTAMGEPDFIDGAHRVWLYSLADIGWMRVDAYEFPDCEILPDGHVFSVPAGRLRRRCMGHVPVRLFFRSRAGRVDATPIRETFDDSTLDGAWRIKLAERVARIWLDADMVNSSDVVMSAMARGLQISPACIEELFLSWRGPCDEGTEQARRDAVRGTIARCMSGELVYHAPGELYAEPSEHDLDTLAVETGRDPWRGIVRSITQGKKTLTGEDIEAALREAKQVEGTMGPMKHTRIRRLLESFGFAKKEATIDGQRRKAFVAEGS